MKLHVRVIDKADNQIFCKILIEKIAKEINEHEQSKSHVVYCDGVYEFELENGQYKVEVYRGKLYYPFSQVVEMNKEGMELNVRLEEVLDVKKLGLYSFDAHSHVSRDEVLDTGNLVFASTVMKGEDFNFFFAGSPYDHEVHLQYLNKNFTDKVPYREKFADTIKQVNNDSYILDIGNEIVKCRYGHAFMMNYVQMPPFSKYYDEEFDPWLFDKVGEEPPYKIAYMYEALIAERSENSVAVAAHPTSWWWHNNDEFITNIATTLGFEILAGSIDAMVVMGYSKDHKYYQELWFDALRNGYFLPGVAETDASFDRPPRRFLEFKTYAIMDEFNTDSLCKSVREGRCIVSSGPIVLMKVNGQYPGSVLKYLKGERFEVEIDAYRCYEAALSKIQILINGTVYKEYTPDQDNIKITDSVLIEEDSFILVKCYDYQGNLAMTNPVYIRNSPFLNKGYMSNVSINITKNSKPANGVYWVDESSEKVAFEGSVRLKMRAASKLNIDVNGEIRTLRLFELEELQKIFKNLYLGWFNANKRYNPGEVPAEEFKLARIREILDNVDISLDF